MNDSRRIDCLSIEAGKRFFADKSFNHFAFLVPLKGVALDFSGCFMNPAPCGSVMPRACEVVADEGRGTSRNFKPLSCGGIVSTG